MSKIKNFPGGYSKTWTFGKNNSTDPPSTRWWRSTTTSPLPHSARRPSQAGSWASAGSEAALADTAHSLSPLAQPFRAAFQGERSRLG